MATQAKNEVHKGKGFIISQNYDSIQCLALTVSPGIKHTLSSVANVLSAAFLKKSNTVNIFFYNNSDSKRTSSEQ